MKERRFVRLLSPCKKKTKTRCTKWVVCVALILTLIVSCFFIGYLFDNGEGEGPQQLASLSNGGEKNLDSSIPTVEGNSELSGFFTILILVDKAPHSLKYTLRSLRESGILNHPRFFEVVIYRQLLHSSTKKQEESDIFAILWDDEMNHNNSNKLSNFSRRVRVMGDRKKLSIAESTITAIRAVNTQYVLYMECDKPVYTFPFGVQAVVTPEAFGPLNAFPHKAEDALRLYIESFITLALQYLEKKKTHVFRLQLYASRLLRNQTHEIYSELFVNNNNNTQGKKMSAEDLPIETYGEDPYTNCHLTPKFHLPSEFCTWTLEKREKYSSAFSLSYCKNWRLFMDAKIPYLGLCNAMCSKEWITTGKGKKPHLSDWNSSKGKYSPLWQFFHETRPINKVNSTTSDTTEGITEDFIARLRKINLETVVTPQGFTHDLLCFPSSFCSWTNRPTLYARSWFLNLVAQKCMVNEKRCLIPGGHEPGVSLEEFVTEGQLWKNDLFHICISDGLFIDYAFEK